MKMSELAKALVDKDMDPEVVVCQGDARFKSEFATVSPAAYRLAFTGGPPAAEPPSPPPEVEPIDRLTTRIWNRFLSRDAEGTLAELEQWLLADRAAVEAAARRP